MFDLKFQGPLFTWSNKNHLMPIAKKLDILLVNSQWISCYPNSSASFLAHSFSDHAPCLLDLSTTLPISGTKPFKFFNFLTKHPSFFSTVENEWIQAESCASNLTELCWKLKSLKGALKTINKDNFLIFKRR